MMNPVRFAVAAAALTLFAASAQASIILETEVDGAATNNSIATAQDIFPGDFTTPTPATVFGSGPTATIVGAGGVSDVDFYKFAAVGGSYLFDMDNAAFSFDTVVSIFDATGTLIAFSDDSAPDAGSGSGLDSFIGELILGPGTYFVAVSQFPNFATVTFSASFYTSLTRPDSAFGGTAVFGATPGDSSFPSNGAQPFEPPSYTLHISQYTAAVPEPSSMVLAAFGGLAFVGRALRRRRN